MRVLEYMAIQRDRIINRHTGEEFLSVAQEETVQMTARTALDILGEIDAMQGLNLKERLSARREYAI